MSSINGMFARRAAASEGSHARDAAKANLLRFDEKREEELTAQSEKISALHRSRDAVKNAALRRMIEADIEKEQQVLLALHAKVEKLARIRAAAASATDDATVDVLAEISANSLPLGRAGKHHVAPTLYEYGPNLDLPEVTKQEAEEAYQQATDALQALKPPVAPEMRSAAAKLAQMSHADVARAELGGAHGGGGARLGAEMPGLLGPSSMLALQQREMEKRLGRPMRESEVLQMREEAKASVMASASLLLGTACAVVAAALAGVVLWRQYGRPRTTEQLQEAQATLSRQQLERKARYEASIGPVVGSLKARAEVAIPEHEGLRTFAKGIHTNQATRVAPAAREAELQAWADARAAHDARDVARAAQERAEAHDKIVAAEAAWQASGAAAVVGAAKDSAER